MAEIKQVQSQAQKQTQKQIQRMSQQQIQGLNFLRLSTRDLRKELDQLIQDNPALEYVDKQAQRQNSYSKKKSGTSLDSDTFQQALESNEAIGETLQEHLISQLNMLNLSEDEYEVCQKLVYNLDKNGFYGSTLAPETLLDSSRPKQNAQLLQKCISLIQELEPVGVCCKNIEESLYVQAKVAGDASPFTLFILNGHLDFLNPPVPEKIVHRCKEFQKEHHKKTFAKKIILDQIDYDEDTAEETFLYIKALNFHPAAGYVYDAAAESYNKPDVVLSIKKEKGYISQDDFEKGLVKGNEDNYFQVYYSGDLPEITVNEKSLATEEEKQAARNIKNNLDFCKSTIILQGCAIVKEQLDFFEKGPDFLKPLTRRKIAAIVGVHESTVSRVSTKNNSKCFQTDWGTFRISYFFSSGVNSVNNTQTQVSSVIVKQKISQIVQENTQEGNKSISDSKITEILQAQGISIARRTVAKYREQLGLKNSYSR